MNRATYFRNVTPEDIRSAMIVHPPYEPKAMATQWAKGYMRLGSSEFVVTGPKMKVCFSGCRWNKLVFALNGAANEEVYAFEKWLSTVHDIFREIVSASPEKYKPGAKTSTRFLFDNDYMKASSDPAMYPDELRTRLSIHRQMVVDSSTSKDDPDFIDIVDTHLFCVSDSSIAIPVDPSEIMAGMEIIPIIRLSYYRNIERFGLVLTVLKGQVFEGDQKTDRPTNSDWEFDYSAMSV